jgi:MarR family transcriptional regulator, organic hydroperoxide resistance regulator
MGKELAGFGWFIKRISNALAREASRNLAAHNLTLQQSNLLFCLSDIPEHTKTLKELEEMFCCAQSTLAGLVSRLEKKGLVEGYTDPSDRRIKHVRLTESGASMRDCCFQDIVRSEERLTAGMSEEEQAMLLECLKKVYVNLQDDMEDMPSSEKEVVK